MRKVSCDLGGDYFENEEWQGSDTAILIRNRKRASRCLQIKTSIGKKSWNYFVGIIGFFQTSVRQWIVVGNTHITRGCRMFIGYLKTEV